MDELGNRIRALRRARGLSPMQVARAADVTREWLSRLERGRIPHPHPEELARVAEALGLTPSELFERAPPAAVPSGAASRAAPTVATIEAIARELVEQGNLALVERLFAPTAMIHGLLPDAPTDRSGLSWVIAELRAAEPGVAVQLDDIITAADKVALRWSLTAGRAGRKPEDTSPPGASISRGMALLRLADGQVVEAWIQAETPRRTPAEIQAALRNQLTPVFGYLQLLVQRPSALPGGPAVTVVEEEVLPRVRRPSALPRGAAVAVVEEEVLPRFRSVLDVLDQMRDVPPHSLSRTGS